MIIPGAVTVHVKIEKNKRLDGKIYSLYHLKIAVQNSKKSIAEDLEWSHCSEQTAYAA